MQKWEHPCNSCFFLLLSQFKCIIIIILITNTTKAFFVASVVAQYIKTNYTYANTIFVQKQNMAEGNMVQKYKKQQ